MFEGSFGGILGLAFFLVFFVVVLFWHFFVGRKKPQQLLEMVNNISEY